MIDWNAMATPPKPVPRIMRELVLAIDCDAKSRMSQEVFFEALDRQDRAYFGGPAERVARNAQYDMFRGAP